MRVHSWGAALTLGFAQQGGDAVLVAGGLSELDQRKEEALQGVVEGLEQGKAQPEALTGNA